MIDTQLILDFWFVQCTPNMWFKKSESFDQLLRTKFKKNIEIPNIEKLIRNLIN